MGKTSADIETMISEAFVLVEASKLSLDDEFMKYEPKTKKQEKFKKQLSEVINNGIKDFWRPKYDPSFNKKGTGICYEKGSIPAVGRTYYWWENAARAICPERHSHLGTKSEYVAFIGVLIKKLVESGWKVDKAWYAVCDDSKELGHYWNSENAKHDFEDTGSRQVCGFFDLANTYKILAYDEEIGGFWMGGCNYLYDGNCYPIADLVHNHYPEIIRSFSVGWVVLY